MRVGIDLGTTNTVVSFIDENGIWNPLEFRRCGSTENPYFLPSCIAVKNGMVIVGQPAVDHGIHHPSESKKNIKYDMGTNTEYNIAGIKITPIQAAEHILYEVRCELDEQFPDEKEFNAFVTVPTRFQMDARLATKESLERAGFIMNESCLTDEPVSAAIAYSSKLENDRLTLVIDIGGGTFDLSLLRASIVGTATGSDRLEPLKAEGDPHLGGNDVDELLVRLMAEKFVSDGGRDLYCAQGSTLDTEDATRAAAMIRSLALSLKKQLYAEGSEGASVYVRDLLGGKPLDFRITVQEYEEQMTELSAKYTASLNKVFAGTSHTSRDVRHVLVVGGMAHEICLLKILERMFGKNKLIIPDEPMLLVSKGAAICNSNLKLHVENRAYTSVGLLKKAGREVETIIEEGSIVKAGQEFTFIVKLDRDDATAAVIELVEYRGRFATDSCRCILKEHIQLANHSSGGGLSKLKRIFGGSVPQEMSVKIKFTEDKLLRIKVVQQDKTETELSLRLGGR